MQRIILLLFLLAFFQLPAYAQEPVVNLLSGRRTSYYTHVYRVNHQEAQANRRVISIVTDACFHSVIDSFSTDHYYDERKLGLPPI